MNGYAAFISYSSNYAEWVEVLQRNLEVCLEACGASPSKVFLDRKDIAPGKSWISQIEGGLVRSGKLVLVLTPESLVSGRVENEWQVIVDRHPDWSRTGKIVPVNLLWTPLPPFLQTIHWLDCTDASDYNDQMARLVGALLDRDPRNLPELPALECPKYPETSLPGGFLKDLVELLAPLLKVRLTRKGIVSALDLKPKNLLEDYPTPELAASALWVHTKGSDDALSATKRLVSTLIDELSDDAPDEVKTLRELAKQLDKPRAAPPQASLLRRYLDQVARDHERLVPVFQQRTELDLLDRVYVRLELRADLERQMLTGHGLKADRRPKGEPGRRLHAAMGIRDLLTLDPETDPWVTRRWVVRGDPGAGKTTLLRHLAATLARDSESAWVPVFESLPRFLRQGRGLLEQLTRKMKILTGKPADGLVGVLDHEAQRGRLLLLLDGFDEVPDREEASTVLRELSEQWPESTIVVTTRPIGYQRPDNAFVEVDILPLDAERQRTFLARWFGRHTDTDDHAAAATALDALQSNGSLSELAGNPLYLTLMALLIERKETLSRRRDKLYDQVFELLLDGKHRPDGEAMECQEKTREALRFLAHGMTEDNLDAAPVIKLEERLYRPEADAFREILERVPRWRRGMRPFLDELATRTGILGPHDGPDSDWRYWHRTFREALASEKLAERFKSPGGEGAILEHARSIEGDESRWAEPYALLAGRLEMQADDLVRALVKENKSLGLRALATAETLQESTITEVLELSDSWKQRVEVYAQLPELVDDPERLLPLLDRLRQRTRNGNDLFHLDLAFAEVAKRSEGVASRAEVLRSRLFDHIPKPPEELFRWIDTPKDGRVELWKTIPAGSFLMGSPEEEGGRHDDEGPQHEVTIEAPFVMAAVPVTVAQFAAFDSGFRAHGWNGVSEEELAFHPAIGMTWFEASMFCRWLSQCFRWAEGARLPGEEEWEYACRAGTITRFWSGDDEIDLGRVGWYDGNENERTHRVGEKPANPWGLYDVHGNAWEWTCSDWDAELYSKRPSSFSVAPRSKPVNDSTALSARRAVRGGCSRFAARNARSAYRNWGDPSYEDIYQSFRVLLPIPPNDRGSSIAGVRK